jgi:hypothetical protein
MRGAEDICKWYLKGENRKKLNYLSFAMVSHAKLPQSSPRSCQIGNATELSATAEFWQPRRFGSSVQ